MCHPTPEEEGGRQLGLRLEALGPTLHHKGALSGAGRGEREGDGRGGGRGGKGGVQRRHLPRLDSPHPELALPPLPSSEPKNTQLSRSWLYFGWRRDMFRGHGCPQHHSA